MEKMNVENVRNPWNTPNCDVCARDCVDDIVSVYTICTCFTDFAIRTRCSRTTDDGVMAKVAYDSQLNAFDDKIIYFLLSLNCRLKYSQQSVRISWMMSRDSVSSRAGCCWIVFDARKTVKTFAIETERDICVSVRRRFIHSQEKMFSKLWTLCEPQCEDWFSHCFVASTWIHSIESALMIINNRYQLSISNQFNASLKCNRSATIFICCRHLLLQPWAPSTPIEMIWWRQRQAMPSLHTIQRVITQFMPFLFDAETNQFQIEWQAQFN